MGQISAMQFVFYPNFSYGTVLNWYSMITFSAIGIFRQF